jgi:hypothetical protein
MNGLTRALITAAAIVYVASAVWYITPSTVVLACEYDPRVPAIVVQAESVRANDSGYGQPQGLPPSLRVERCSWMPVGPRVTEVESPGPSSDRRLAHRVLAEPQSPWRPSPEFVEAHISQSWTACDQGLLIVASRSDTSRARFVFKSLATCPNTTMMKRGSQLLWLREATVDHVGRFTVAWVGAAQRSPEQRQRVRDALMTLDASVNAEWSRPLIIVDGTTTRSPNTLIDTGGQFVAVPIEPTSSPDTTALVTGAWAAMWRGTPHTNVGLAKLLTEYGAVYCAVNVLGTEEEATAYNQHAIAEYYNYIGGRSVRPVAGSDAIGVRWESVLPGMLALCAGEWSRHSGKQMSSWVLRITQELGTENGDNAVAQLLSESPFCMSVLMRGQIPGVDTPETYFLPRWMTEPLHTTRTMKSEVSACTEAIVLCANGGQAGYLETCGCRAAQQGGVARRAHVLKSYSNGSTLSIDCGHWMSTLRAPRRDELDQAETNTFVDAMALAQYAAVGLGWKDLLNGALDRTASNNADGKLPLVCSNVLKADGDTRCKPFVVRSLGGVQVAIIGWVSLDCAEEYRAAVERSIEPMYVCEDRGLLNATIQMARAQADKVILIGQLSHAVCRTLAADVPGIDIIVTGESDRATRARFEETPAARARRHNEPYTCNKTLILSSTLGRNGLSVYQLGSDMGAVEAWNEVRLDESVPKDRGCEGLVAALATAVGRSFDAVTVDESRMYAGSELCGGCHHEEAAHWRTTPHSMAMRSLVRVQRERHPECVSCHVTGYGASGGFADSSRRKQLENVGCEVCHGPGMLHAQTGGREAIVRVPTTRVCFMCHDEEHSDQFVGRLDDAMRFVSHPLGRSKAKE